MRQLPSRREASALFRLPPNLGARPANLLDVPRLLELVEASVAAGCRDHYTPPQRHAVYLSYVSHLFVDVVSEMETWLIEGEALPLAVAQLDPIRGRLRALFVAPARQGQGLGRLLLSGMEAMARKRGVHELHGAMSMNAVSFYQRAGFLRLGAAEVVPMFGIGVVVQTMRKMLM